jgi:predicted XRE-type DNA-binding protein
MSEEKRDEDLVVRGSGNFLADQGIADPDEFRVKTHLCHEIATIAERRGLAPEALAELVGMSEQDVVSILRSLHDAIDVWKLIKVLNALGADVGISVLPDCGHEVGTVFSETIRNDNETALRELAQMDEVDYQPEPRL